MENTLGVFPNGYPFPFPDFQGVFLAPYHDNLEGSLETKPRKV